MFWSFSLTLDTGVTISYWKLINVYIEVSNMTGVCKAYGYLDQASSDAGKDHVIEREYVIDFTPLSQGGALTAGVVSLVQVAQAAQVS